MLSAAGDCLNRAFNLAYQIPLHDMPEPPPPSESAAVFWQQWKDWAQARGLYLWTSNEQAPVKLERWIAAVPGKGEEGEKYLHAVVMGGPSFMVDPNALGNVRHEFVYSGVDLGEVVRSIALLPIGQFSGGDHLPIGGDVAAGVAPSWERVNFHPTGESDQRYFAFGIQHRDYVAGTSLEIAAVSMGLSFNGLTYSGTLTSPVNHVRTLDRSGTISSGTFSLNCDGQTTSALAYNANAATIQAALEALTHIGPGNVVVTGGPLSTTDVVLTFQGELAGCVLPSITLNNSLGGGGSVSMAATASGFAGYVAAALYDSWTTICDTGNLSLIGPYRVTAVVYDAATTSDIGAAKLKLVHGVGDSASTAEAPLKPSPSAVGDFSIVDFGRVDIPQVPTGTQRWRGAIQGMTEGTLGASMRVVKIRFEPLECGDGVIKAISPDSGTLVLSENFGATSGALTGDTATLGGTWASMGGVSDPVDFTETAAPDNAVIRTELSDNSTDLRYGRGVVLGSAIFTDMAVGVTCKASTRPATPGARMGVIARFTDNNNFIAALLLSDSGGTHANLTVYRVLAGSVSSLGSVLVNPAEVLTGFTWELIVRSGGSWSVASGGKILKTGYNSALESGTLSSGKAGLLDYCPSAGACTRTYSDFYCVDLPPLSTVAYSEQPLEIRDSGEAWRMDAAGDVYGYPQKQTIPNAPMLGPAGAEGLSNRIYADWSRFNPDLAAHTVNDPGRVDVHYRPAYEVAVWEPQE